MKAKLNFIVLTEKPMTVITCKFFVIIFISLSSFYFMRVFLSFSKPRNIQRKITKNTKKKSKKRSGS